MVDDVREPLDLWQQATEFPAPGESALDKWQQSLEKLSHDLNNALVPVHARIDVLQMQLSDRHAESIEKIREALHNIAEVLQTSTHWHKDKGRSPNINDAELRFRWEQTCQSLGIEMHWHIDLEAWGLERAQDLSTCLEVLVRNSCDALQQGRLPHQGRIEIHCGGDETMSWLQVQDNGGGCADLITCIESEARRGSGHMGLGLTSLAAHLQHIGGRLRIINRDEGFVAMVRIARQPVPN